MVATSPSKTCTCPKKKPPFRFRTQEDCNPYSYRRANLKFHLQPQKYELTLRNNILYFTHTDQPRR